MKGNDHLKYNLTFGVPLIMSPPFMLVNVIIRSTYSSSF